MSEPFDPYHKWLGIPPEDQPPNHYRLLGIELFEPDGEVISNAANRQMAYVRNFQTEKRSALAQKIRNEISGAKNCLLNKDRREEYNRTLHGQLRRPEPKVSSPPPITRPSHEDEMTNTQISPADLSPTHNQPGWKAQLPLVLSSTAFVLSLLAFAVALLRDPLGKGLDAYDFSTPRAALISQLQMTAHLDVRAVIELTQIREGKKVEEKIKTVKVHTESNYRGKKLLFISFKENGLWKYDVEGFEKHTDTGWWFPVYVSTYDIDDSSLKTAIEKWKEKTGKIESDN